LANGAKLSNAATWLTRAPGTHGGRSGTRPMPSFD
jgi:hypothetical protein